MLSMTILSTSMIVLGAVYYYKQFGENTAIKVLPVIFAPIFMFAYGAGTIWLLDLCLCLIIQLMCGRHEPPHVGVCGGAAAARVPGAGGPRHRPHRHLHLHRHQNIPDPGPGAGVTRNILGVCCHRNVIQCFLLFFCARDQRKIFA